MFYLFKPNKNLLIPLLLGLFILTLQGLPLKLVSQTKEANLFLAGPKQVLVNPQTNYLFVLNRVSNKLSILNAKEKKFIVNLPIDGENPISMKSDKKGNLYVLNKDSNNLTIFPFLFSKSDFSQKSISQIIRERKTIPTFQTPGAFAIDEELEKIYITNPAVRNLLIYEQKINKFSSRETGRGPSKILVNPNNHKVYITNIFDKSLSIFNGKTNEWIKNLEIGNPAFNLLLGPENKIFVSSQKDNHILIIDGTTDKIIGKIENGLDGPGRMAIDFLLRKLFVINRNSSSLSIFNLTDYRFVKNISLPPGSFPSAVSINKDLNLAFVVNQGKDSISIIDNLENRLITTLEVRANPGRAEIDSSSNKIYIPHASANIITVINLLTRGNFKIETIENSNPTETTFALPLGLAVNENKNEIYVLNNLSENFLIIDGKNFNIEKKISVGSNPQKILFIPESNKILVLNSGENSITRYNLIDGTIKEILTGKAPIDWLFNPKTNLIYTLNSSSQSLSVIDLEKEIRLTEIPIESRPGAIALDSGRNKIYLSLPNVKKILVIDGKTNQIINIIKTELAPYNILCDPSSNRIFVANNNDASLTVIDGQSNQIIKTLTVGSFPTYFAFDGRKIYLSITGQNRIRVIDPNNLDDTPATIRTTMNPTKIIINPEKEKIFTLSKGGFLNIAKVKSSKSSFLDIYKTAEISKKSGRGILADLAYNQKTKKLFVVMSEANALAIVDILSGRLEKVITNSGVKTIKGLSFSSKILRFFGQYIFIILFLIIIGFLIYYFRDKILKYLSLKRK